MITITQLPGGGFRGRVEGGRTGNSHISGFVASPNIMLDKSRTATAWFIVQHLPGRGPLVTAASLWRAAEADNLEQKRRCLKEVLRLDPENEAATLALLLLDQRRPTS